MRQHGTSWHWHVGSQGGLLRFWSRSLEIRKPSCLRRAFAAESAARWLHPKRRRRLATAMLPAGKLANPSLLISV